MIEPGRFSGTEAADSAGALNVEVPDGTVCPSALQLPSDRCGNVPISTHKHAQAIRASPFYFIHRSLHCCNFADEIRSSVEHCGEFWVFLARRGSLKGP